MPTPTTNRTREGEYETRGFGTQVPFESINEPGCYVCNWTGHLLRIPEDAIKPGRSPLMSITAADQLFVTKISSNPFIPVSKARMLAADCDVLVNF